MPRWLDSSQPVQSGPQIVQRFDKWMLTLESTGIAGDRFQQPALGESHITQVEMGARHPGDERNQPFEALARFV